VKGPDYVHDSSASSLTRCYYVVELKTEDEVQWHDTTMYFGHMPDWKLVSDKVCTSP
jgi:hypothetical protein